MRITENRKLALVVCIICAVISIFGIGGMKLNGDHNAVTGVFVNGADAQHNIEYYLERACGYAADLAYESMQYLDDDAAANDVLMLCDMLNGEEGPRGARYENYVALTRGVEMLYSELQSAGYGEEAAIEIAYYDYQGVCDMIKRDDYHAVAAEYNAKVASFPAGLIASIWGVGSANAFGQ